MIRQFLKDSTIYGISGIVTRGISLLLVPFYTRVFTPGDYGVIDLIAIMSSIVGFVFPLEITQAVARFYPDVKSAQEGKQFASTALIFTIIAYAVFGLLGFTLGESFISIIFNERLDPKIIWIATLSIITNGLFYFFQNQLRWRLEPKKHALSSITFSLLAIGLTIVFVLLFNSGVLGVFYAQAVGGLVGGALSFALGRSSFSLTFNTSRLWEMLSFSLPLVPSSVGIFVLTYSDRIFITRFMSLDDLGIFGIGQRVASIVGVLMLGFQAAITPIVYSNYKDPRTPVQFARVFRYFIAGAMVLAASLSVFSREILIVLTTEAYYSAVLVIPFLVVSTFLSGMYVFAPGLGIAKKTKLIASINFVGAFVNVILNIALIPTFGIVGAAVSTLISSIGIFVVNMFASQREYKIPHDTKKLMLSVIIASVLGTIGYFVNAYSVVLTIGAKFLVLGLLVVALVVLRLVDMDEIRMYLLKHREHSRLESNSPKA